MSEQRHLRAVPDTPAPAAGPALLRCECGHCGAHMIALLHLTDRDFCLNCGSPDLRPLSQD